MTRIIAIVNQKGGVGKTTTSVNLSACLADQGKKVLLVDIDPQGNSTSGLGINKHDLKQSIYDVLINEYPIEMVIEKTSYPNLTVVPATIGLAGAEIELVSTISREIKLKQALEFIKDQYDFIIIDCPPSLGLLTINALAAANELLVPIQCEFYALEGLSQLINSINLIRKYINPKLEVRGVLLTMYDARTRLSQEVADEVRKHFPNEVFKTVIHRNIRLGEAPSYGQPIIEYAPNSTGSKAYLALTQEVIERG